MGCNYSKCLEGCKSLWRPVLQVEHGKNNCGMEKQKQKKKVLERKFKKLVHNCVGQSIRRNLVLKKV